MKLLIIFIYLLTLSFGHATDKPNIKNLVVNENLKTYEQGKFDLIKFLGNMVCSL